MPLNSFSAETKMLFGKISVSRCIKSCQNDKFNVASYENLIEVLKRFHLCSVGLVSCKEQLNSWALIWYVLS